MRAVEGYEKHLYPNHKTDLDNRRQIDIDTYETMYTFNYPQDGSHLELDSTLDAGPYVISHIDGHIRYYTKK